VAGVCGTRSENPSFTAYALLAIGVGGFDRESMRQWVLSVPFPLRFLFASQPKVMGKALGIVYRTIATHLTRKAGYTKSTAHAGAVTLIQRFGGALNGLAWLYHENGKPGALVMARKASKLAPDNPAIQDTYGWILVQSGGGLPQVLLP